ncbi:MAG: outer membrane beta-barrel protein [Legionella longbeachae]|nr:outer membrane beta-barrel protein [Legionella longbeachae]
MIRRRCTRKFAKFLVLALFFIPTISAYGHIYLGGTLAANFAHLGNRSPQITYFSGTTITDDYPLKSNNKITTVYGANGGYEFTSEHMKPTIALGLGIYGNLGDYHFDGQVVETATGNLSNTLYDYSFNITSTRLMAEIQLNWELSQFAPFLNFGLGSAWNSMTSYREIAINGTTYPPLMPFRSHMNNNFAYQVGFGVSTAINLSSTKSNFEKDRISIGYRYINLGQTTFGTRGPEYPFKLNTGLLQTNEIYVGYTHLF